jgi:hypothetical protein
MRSRWISLLCVAVLMAALFVVSLSGCKEDTTETTEDSSVTTEGESTAVPSGDVDGTVGDSIRVGKAVITVRAVEATFNPVAPSQRMSEQTPSAPDGNESFYQAFVKVENRGTAPLRVDPDDFACAVGSAVAGIEPTWSGPGARSLLKNSSLELVVTFKAKAGYEPVLLYSPSWYKGTIRIAPVSASTVTSAEG